ncbi:MAG: hypothetical protein PHF21_04335 [Bacilli bacterium]|nr:hypothetical protein [Bacilli bacterium]
MKGKKYLILIIILIIPIVIFLYAKSDNKKEPIEVNVSPYVKIVDSKLKSDIANVDILVKFNNKLYARSYSLIDYRGGSIPIGFIDKLVNKEYVPKENNETNTKEILNSNVYESGENQIVILYNESYTLFEKLEENLN